MRNNFKILFSCILVLSALTCSTPKLLKSQWIKQYSPVLNMFTDIDFINVNTGWACSTTNISNDTTYIIKTTNGGLNWFKQYSGAGYLFRTIFALDSNTVYCGGYIYNTSSTPLLLKTTNGGLYWENKMPPSKVYDIYFCNKDSGWYSANNSTPQMMTTTNGGNSWIARSNNILSTMFIISFLNYSTGWCSGYYSLYKTTNAGLNWSLTGYFDATISSMFFLNQNYGWAGLQTGKVVRTTDGGNCWDYHSTPAEGSLHGVTDLYFFNNMKGFAGCISPKVLKTYDGGQSWGYQIDTGCSERFSFVDTLTGWTVYNYISKTTNGGGQVFYPVFTPSAGNPVPETFSLYQNYPNPFNPSTTIKVDITKISAVRLIIYDVTGKILYEIKDQTLNPGTFEFNWDASGYSSGIYFCRFISNNFSDTKKMLLIK